jgi:AraC-like DNA-binding protein
VDHGPISSSAVEKFDTLRLAPSKRLTFWNELVEQVYTGTWVNTPKQDFAAEMWRWQVGDLKMIRPISDPAQVGRSADLSTDEEHLVLHLQRRGKSRQRQERREAELAPGDFILVSAAQSYTIEANSHEMLVVQFPRRLIEGKVRAIDDRIATLVSGAGPSQRVFHDFLMSLWRQGDQTHSDPDWQSGVGHVFADLLALAVNIAPAETEIGPGSPLRRRVLTLIEARLSDPDLRTASIAEELGITPRTVQNIFAAMGTTPVGYIAERRLQRAAEMLVSNPTMSVTEIAFELGFNDSAYFARCFRQHFAMSASEYRSRA